MEPVSRVAHVSTFVLVVLLAASVPEAASQTAVTVCGQLVRGDAYLTDDLDCSPDTEAAVQLEGGSLDLRGFTIRGGEYGVLCATTLDEELEIYRYLTCRVFGGGIITGQSVFGIDGRTLVVDDVTVAVDTGFAIIVQKHLTFTNVTLQLGADATGTYGPRAKIEGTNLTLTGGKSGVAFTKKILLDGVTATGYSDRGISGVTVKLRNASLTGGAYGVVAAHGRVESSVITGSSIAGIHATFLKVIGSTVTGNALDLQSEHRPRVEDTTCDTSNGWGVCSSS
jgi:hypothetical protein